jgi:NAD(P)H-hydrate repair Nnr-like enzyme with NAD(P)H-hydrate dehydratase domain
VEHVAALLDSVGGLVLALTGLLGALAGWRRTQRVERSAAARSGAEKFAQAIAEAAEDGELTPEEIAEALKHMRDPQTDDEQGGEQGDRR